MFESISQRVAINVSFLSILFSLLLSLVLSILIAFVYKKTFLGLSYSKSYVNSVILASLATSIIMLAIGDSIARGIGMIGAMALIRFRTNFKDPWDLIFMFVSLAIGISCGVFAYNVAVAGTFVFSLAAFGIYFSDRDNMKNGDFLLRFSIKNRSSMSIISDKLNESCKKLILLNIKENSQGDGLFISYEIQLKKDVDKLEFINQLKDIDIVNSVQLVSQNITEV